MAVTLSANLYNKEPIVKEEKIVGFEDDENDKLKLLKKKKKKKISLTKKPGGFQSMGLGFPILKAIQKRGYKVPTPIQRKTVPLVLEGRDVVAMARTGSGKTAAFLIPMFEKLKCRGTQAGIRAIILSPTRELALQTMRFVKELGRYTGLRHSVIVGGDSMESQFSTIHTNPDIVIATPGRLLHICVEMELKLNNVEIIIFDEADRLFEMGFGEQLKEIIGRLPESRQTLLFSATLPKMLVEFARAGLSDPVLIRLDVEAKLPETLNISFIACRSDEKPAALLCLLNNVIKEKSQTIVFAATKHHVEFLHTLLNCKGIRNTFIYSDLDPSARKINAAKFQTGQVEVLLVTDIAARGIDIPQLDYVINYNFPAKPKLFVHRVGRCARAGREGWALSLVSSDEVCYMLDIHLFLGRPVKLVSPAETTSDTTLLGAVPHSLLDAQLSEIFQWEITDPNLLSVKKVSENGYKQYIKCRQGASRESVKRSKEVNLSLVGNHALFNKSQDTDESARAAIISGIHSYRPSGTIFEIGQSSHSELYTIMKKKRKTHGKNILLHKQKVLEKANEIAAKRRSPEEKLEESNIDEIHSTFSSVISNKRKPLPQDKDGKTKVHRIDKENFVPYKPADHHTEEGLAVNSFQRDASAVGLDLTGDTEACMKSGLARKVWDKKRKKMVAVERKRKIRGESGGWIDASFKSGRYQQWMDSTKLSSQDQESTEDTEPKPQLPSVQTRTHWQRHNLKVKTNKTNKSAFKNPEQILKARDIKEKRRRRSMKKKKNN